MNRTITLLALFQVLLVIIGFLALGIVLKLSGYPDALRLHWNPLAVFLREHGFLLLLLPLLWTIYAVAAERVQQGWLLPRLAFSFGVGLALLLIPLFLYAAVFAYTRPLLIHVP